MGSEYLRMIRTNITDRQNRKTEITCTSTQVPTARERVNHASLHIVVKEKVWLYTPLFISKICILIWKKLTWCSSLVSEVNIDRQWRVKRGFSQMKVQLACIYDVWILRQFLVPPGCLVVWYVNVHVRHLQSTCTSIYMYAFVDVRQCTCMLKYIYADVHHAVYMFTPMCMYSMYTYMECMYMVYMYIGLHLCGIHVGQCMCMPWVTNSNSQAAKVSADGRSAKTPNLVLSVSATNSTGFRVWEVFLKDEVGFQLSKYSDNHSNK